MNLISMLFMAHVAYNYESYVRMTKLFVSKTLKYWEE